MAGPFELQLRAFGQKALDNYDAAIRETLINFTSAVIDSSPVGDPSSWKRPAPAGYSPGQFKGNWLLGVGSAPTGTLMFKDPGGAVTKSRIAAMIPQQASGRTYHFVNNLPYAWRLEMDGWSHQAPFGFLGLRTLEFSLIVSAAAAAARNGTVAASSEALVPA